MPSDAARLRELEAERDAAIRERDEARQEAAEARLHADRMTKVDDVADRLLGVARTIGDQVIQERDAAVAACAVKDEALQVARPYVAKRASHRLTPSGKNLALIDVALSTAPGARLLEEVRRKTDRERLLDAVVAAWDRAQQGADTKHGFDSWQLEVERRGVALRDAREALRRFDEETKR